MIVKFAYASDRLSSSRACEIRSRADVLRTGHHQLVHFRVTLQQRLCLLFRRTSSRPVSLSTVRSWPATSASLSNMLRQALHFTQNARIRLQPNIAILGLERSSRCFHPPSSFNLQRLLARNRHPHRLAVPYLLLPEPGAWLPPAGIGPPCSPFLGEIDRPLLPRSANFSTGLPGSGILTFVASRVGCAATTTTTAAQRRPTSPRSSIWVRWTLAFRLPIALF